MQDNICSWYSWFDTQKKMSTLMFESGLKFPINSINGILVTNTDKEKMKIDQHKNDVLSFIETRKKVYLSELCEKFNLDIVESKLILNKLQKEGKIQLNE